jgi:excinuclease ABC subunit C
MINDLCRFLQGHTEEITERIGEEMLQASETMQFERAAALRDQLVAIERVVEGQKVVSQERIDSDVIAFARDDIDACVQVFFIRSGKLIGREYFVLDGTNQAQDRELVEAFVKQFYTGATYIPQKVLLPTEIEEAKIIEQWLKQRRNGKVEIVVPQRGQKKQLIEMAKENAADTLAALRARWEADRSKHVKALAELQEMLGLEVPPARIEGYDISNIQGTAAAGSMVVFEQGAPSKSYYRKFTIKTVQGQDDFASMEEVLERRFRRYQISKEEAAKPGGKLDKAFGLLPDLMIVDGGKGQLGRAVNVLEAFGVADRVPVVGLAKGHEELFLPYEPDPIILPRRSEGLYLVQRIRDEAHRFALRHHRTRRRKAGLRSQLDQIPGIGPARRKSLLQKFGDIEGIRKASVEDIMQIRGITREIAEDVKSLL